MMVALLSNIYHLVVNEARNLMVNENDNSTYVPPVIMQDAAIEDSDFNQVMPQYSSHS